jgi:hypothetical protein
MIRIKQSERQGNHRLAGPLRLAPPTADGRLIRAAKAIMLIGGNSARLDPCGDRCDTE